MRIIGLSGYAQSGKDTVGKYLIEKYGFKRISFADKLREVLYAQNPIVVCDVDSQRRVQDVVDYYGWEAAKSTFVEIRQLLQALGTEAGRKVLGENVWVEAALRDLPDGNYVVTDVRFPNEAEAVHELWRVVRPGYGPINDHPSETALDNFVFDRIIRNDSTLTALHSRTEVALFAGYTDLVQAIAGPAESGSTPAYQDDEVGPSRIRYADASLAENGFESLRDADFHDSWVPAGAAVEDAPGDDGGLLPGQVLRD